MSCYTLFNECRLPWPSSNCLYVLTPFASRLNTPFVTALQLTVYPALPDLLTKPRPTSVSHITTYLYIRQACYLAHLKFESKSKRCDPILPIIIFTSRYCLLRHSYSKEYFGWNQLLNCSMSLSLLNPTSTSDLHVNTVRVLPVKFPSPSNKSGLDHNLSGFNHIT